ncbi:nucleotide exchange factor GrpE [Candidatus Uhrbacteria bacterium]|nr:nucleotide exchange factor GrpE [Candidatus Uhrbacteria bacterium]
MSDDTLTLEGAFKKIEELNEKIKELTKQNEENLNGWKRAKADYINFKNDSEKRRDELNGLAMMTSAAQNIPILGNFKKAFSMLPDDLKNSEWVKGIEQIYKQMKEMIKGLGVEEYAESVIGVPFDPTKHYAVGEERIDTQEDGVITQEVSPGYTFRGTVIVPAKVIVNKKQNNS